MPFCRARALLERAIIEALASKNTQRVIDLVVQHVDKEVE